MTDQPGLFLEDYSDALRALVMALGGYKRVGADLRPELPIEQAGRWLSDCCNPDRRDQLNPNHLALLRRKGREAGCHILATYEADAAGYAEPVPLVPSDQVADLQRKFIAAVDDQKALLAQLERLMNRKP